MTAAAQWVFGVGLSTISHKIVRVAAKIDAILRPTTHLQHHPAPTSTSHPHLQLTADRYRARECHFCTARAPWLARRTAGLHSGRPFSPSQNATACQRTIPTAHPIPLRAKLAAAVAKAHHVEHEVRVRHGSPRVSPGIFFLGRISPLYSASVPHRSLGVPPQKQPTMMPSPSLRGVLVVAVALLTSPASAEPQHRQFYRWNAPELSTSDLARRQAPPPGYHPEFGTCGSGTTCGNACGTNWLSCKASTDLSLFCYNKVQLKQTCCENGSGRASSSSFLSLPG